MVKIINHVARISFWSSLFIQRTTRFTRYGDQAALSEHLCNGAGLYLGHKRSKMGHSLLRQRRLEGQGNIFKMRRLRHQSRVLYHPPFTFTPPASGSRARRNIKHWKSAFLMFNESFQCLFTFCIFCFCFDKLWICFRQTFIIITYLLLWGCASRNDRQTPHPTTPAVTYVTRMNKTSSPVLQIH